MTPFRKYSIVGGWIVFAVALLTYMLTLEPTASLWDCSEFIATSYKLEVGHPPGTPLFFLINRIGAMFATGPEGVGYAINALSALESALTIAFLFWTVAHLARKIMRKTASEMTSGEVWAAMGAAAVGSLAYAFTDTFWFSAVEAEVYALSSLFTAVVFWMMLRWESVADEPGANRWLVLIAYVMGLSIGAHILNLLTIPALVFIYYFKKFPAAPKSGLWKPAVASIVLTGLFYILTPTAVSIGAWVDRVFVNSFGFGVNSGLATFIALLLVGLGFFAWKAHKRGKQGLNTVLISVAMIVVGFSSYGVVLIRSSVNPPMNSNHPDNPYSLVQFLNREQYGSRPLLYGQSYASPAIDYVENNSYYIDSNGKYAPYSYIVDAEYDPATTGLFPRMYDRTRAEEYKSWADVKGRKVRSIYSDEMITVPTFGENLRFFVGYQVNHMYWRYFLWNFVGRQTDRQSDGLAHGNWLSGISFIDELFFGPQDNLPDELANNRGRNTYFFLPLILGLIGFFYQLKKEGRGFLVTFLLFFMTGLAIILYLNQPPSQPRERDYAYAASFYAFAIWIGLGVVALWRGLSFRMKGKVVPAAALATVLGLSVPAILAAENWDDHDRSGRTWARDMGVNYLTNLPPNTIFINYGDNDTFPVWFAQEVLGERLDVRVMNTQYISGDWYADQMRIKSNNGEALPISLPRSKYKAQSSPIFYVKETARPGGGDWTIQEVMQVVNSDAPATKVFTERGESFDFIPARRIAVPVNKENVVKSGIVRAEDAHLIADTMWVNIKGNSLQLGDMVLLDIIATSDWTRPIHFTSASGVMNLGLTFTDPTDGQVYTYLQTDGASYRLVPIKTPVTKRYWVGRVDTELLWDNLMNKYRYGGIKNGAYVDQFVSNTLTQSQFRTAFARLASSLAAAGDTVRAVAALDRAMEELPVASVGRDDQLVDVIEMYWVLGAQAKGDALAEDYYNAMLDQMSYFERFKGSQSKAVEQYIMDAYTKLYGLYRAAVSAGQAGYAERLAPYFSQE